MVKVHLVLVGRRGCRVRAWREGLCTVKWAWPWYPRCALELLWRAELRVVWWEGSLGRTRLRGAGSCMLRNWVYLCVGMQLVLAAIAGCRSVGACLHNRCLKEVLRTCILKRRLVFEIRARGKLRLI
jgi:hypothetical protein